MDTKLRKFIKTEYYKGKTLPARLIDSVFFKLLVFLGLFVVFWLMNAGILRALVLAATVTASVGIFKFIFTRTRLMSFSQNRIERAKEECMLEKLVLLDNRHRKELMLRVLQKYTGEPKNKFVSMDGGYLFDKTYCFVFPNHPKYPVTVEQVSKVLRTMRAKRLRQCVLISSADFDADAQAMAIRRCQKAEFLSKNTLIKLLQGSMLYPSDEEAYRFLEGEMEERRITREKVKNAFFDADKGRAFALCALVLAIWPFVTGFNIIYPIAAAGCTALSIYAFIKGKSRA